jgi:hypothetical protein
MFPENHAGVVLGAETSGDAVVKLHAGDRVIANCGGKTGRGVVIEDQDGESVRFQWDQARPGAAPVVALRDRLVYVPPPAHLTTPLADEIERIEQRYDP